MRGLRPVHDGPTCFANLNLWIPCWEVELNLQSDTTTVHPYYSLTRRLYKDELGCALH